MRRSATETAVIKAKACLLAAALVFCCTVSGRTETAEEWIKLGTTKTCVAVANKNARIIWALLARDEAYRAAA